MSRQHWTRPARLWLAVLMVTGIGCLEAPAGAQDAAPPPSVTETDTQAPTDSQPPEPAAEDTSSSAPSSEAGAASEQPAEPPAAETSTPETGAPQEQPPAEGAPPETPTTPLAPILPAIGLETGAPQPAVEPAPPVGPPPVAPTSSPWSFALTVGYYSPRLGTLNQVLEDTSVTFLEDPNFLLPRNQNLSFEQRNLAVEGIEGGATYGLDTFYNTGGPHSFGLSFSSWRGETFGQDMISLFLRSNQDPIIVPRSARYNLILDQIFLEWRYHLFRKPDGKGLYLNAGLVGVTLAFFTMDALVNVVDPQLSFASVSSDESFGWGYTTRFGIGGTYPLTSWLSIGGRANYILGNIQNLEVTRHFEAGFPQFPVPNPLSVRPGVPLPQLFFTPREGKRVEYATVATIGDIEERVGPERDLTLELSGWEGLIELAVHF
jgi:hypothetical protein